MNYLLAFILLIVVFILTNEREAYDMFGFSGYVVPKQTQLMDPYPELRGYEQVKNDATADLMESVVLLTNKEIHKRTGIANYIIETMSMKKFIKKDDTVYECQFMTVKKDGFSFGFSVTVWFIGEEKKPLRLLAIRSQPIGYQNSDQTLSFVGQGMGKDFESYKLIRNNHTPDRSDFDASMKMFRDPELEVIRPYVDKEPESADVQSKRVNAELLELREDIEENVNVARKKTDDFLRNLENDQSLVNGLRKIGSTVSSGFETVKNKLQ